MWPLKALLSFTYRSRCRVSCRRQSHRDCLGNHFFNFFLNQKTIDPAGRHVLFRSPDPVAEEPFALGLCCGFHVCQMHRVDPCPRQQDPQRMDDF